ncbi:MAG TPA: MarR family transcriptional regulator [Bacillota bacterium]|nr:MarR family transcriptional regulator [Bacillota bacterium]
MGSIHTISKLLMKNNQLYFTLVARELDKCGITIPQALVLGEIRDKPKTIGELSKALDLSNSTISGIVDRLERNQIVIRERDKEDRRVVFVSLSRNVHELENQYPVLQQDYLAILIGSLISDLGDEELSQLLSSLQLIQSFLEKKVGKPTT